MSVRLITARRESGRGTRSTGRVFPGAGVYVSSVGRVTLPGVLTF